MDAQLPPALARRIVALGHAAEHVADCGLTAAPDETIRSYAAETGAVIRIGNTRRVELLRRIEADFAEIIAALERREALVEIA